MRANVLLPVKPCLLSISGSCFTLSPSYSSVSPLTFPFLLSLPSQEVGCHGNIVLEKVEQGMKEIKDRLTFWEKREREQR